MLQTRGPTWVFLLLALAGPARAAAPQLSGRYRSEGLGELEFTTRDGRVVARYVAGGSCAFQPDQEVVTGAFEDNVLVATLAVCQQGVSCPDRSYPVLAFWRPEDGSLSAHVKLDSGCSSPALHDTLLRLAPVVDAAPATVQTLRAPLDAKTARRFQRAFTRAAEAVNRARWEEGARLFEEALRYDPANWAAHLGLGVAELGRGNTEDAIREYERARALDPTQRDVYYNLACAHARLRDRPRALAFLRQAVERGFEEADMMVQDRDLSGLLGEDPEFQRLVQQVRGTQRAAARGGR